MYIRNKFHDPLGKNSIHLFWTLALDPNIQLSNWIGWFELGVNSNWTRFKIHNQILFEIGLDLGFSSLKQI